MKQAGMVSLSFSLVFGSSIALAETLKLTAISAPGARNISDFQVNFAHRIGASLEAGHDLINFSISRLRPTFGKTLPGICVLP